MLRAEDYGKRLVPPKVRFLLASVDVQGGKKRRFVVQIIGYGENGERWLVDRYNIRQSLRCDENGEAQQVHPGSIRKTGNCSSRMFSKKPMRCSQTLRDGCPFSQWLSTVAGKMG